MIRTVPRDRAARDDPVQSRWLAVLPEPTARVPDDYHQRAAQELLGRETPDAPIGITHPGRGLACA